MSERFFVAFGHCGCPFGVSGYTDDDPEPVRAVAIGQVKRWLASDGTKQVKCIGREEWNAVRHLFRSHRKGRITWTAEACPMKVI